MDRILEIVSFPTKPGTDMATLLDAARACEPFLRACPGFVARRLGQSEDGTWLDCVEWESMDAARHAAATFHTHPATAAFMGVIDMSGTTMRHYAVMLRQA